MLGRRLADGTVVHDLFDCCQKRAGMNDGMICICECLPVSKSRKSETACRGAQSYSASRPPVPCHGLNQDAAVTVCAKCS